MIFIGQFLANAGYTLRSGGADGADTAFENGCDLANGKKEIFLPWRKFNGNPSQLYDVSNDALYLASQMHPAWSACSPGAKKLHARNTQQVLGENLDDLTTFVICWTKDGKATGGTATAIKLARECKTPVFNLFNKDEEKELMEFLDKVRKGIL